MSPADFERVRREYDDAALRRRDLPADPVALLRTWLEAAAAAGAPEPNGMALATCDAEGQPHCRIVLLKGIDAGGLLFFTNRRSHKGAHLAANARAAATFWWQTPRNRQVRVLGAVEMVDDAESDRYFATRPRAAQLAAAASPQSEVIAGRAELERRCAELAAAVGGGPIARPPHWGGYRLRPHDFEFWQGRTARLHDRFRYEAGAAGWRIDRLAP